MSEVRPEHESGFRFDSVLVREVRFADNRDKVEPARLEGLRVNVSIETEVAEDERSCATRLHVMVAPGPGSDEFHTIFAILEGRFSAVGESTSVEIREFANRQAPAILMPFAREAIASVTSKSRFGQLLLPPINVAALVAHQEDQARQAGPQSG